LLVNLILQQNFSSVQCQPVSGNMFAYYGCPISIEKTKSISSFFNAYTMNSAFSMGINYFSIEVFSLTNTNCKITTGQHHYRYPNYLPKLNCCDVTGFKQIVYHLF